MQRQLVDEDIIAELTREIDDHFLGKGAMRPLREILRQISSYGTFATEFIDRLEELEAHRGTRTMDRNAYVQEALRQTTRIRMRAAIWNVK